MSDRLFLWITAQHLNPVAGRDVYACPSRAYYVHAALRLAKLVASIREKQADCPVTLVCHSQGNMIGLAAAFLGERFDAVADTYILANPPYSLVDHNFLEDWSQRGARDGAGQRGRQTYAARRDTLKAFFQIREHDFWHPPSPTTRFDLVQGVASNSTVFGKILTVASALPLWLVGAVTSRPVNAVPPEDWEIPINAPALLENFIPRRCVTARAWTNSTRATTRALRRAGRSRRTSATPTTPTTPTRRTKPPTATPTRRWATLKAKRACATSTAPACA